MANASKIHEGKEMAEIIRLMVDIAAGTWPTCHRTGISKTRESAIVEEVPQGNRGSPRGTPREDAPAGEKLALESADTVSDSTAAAPPRPPLDHHERVGPQQPQDIAKRLAGIEAA